MRVETHDEGSACEDVTSSSEESATDSADCVNSKEIAGRPRSIWPSVAAFVLAACMHSVYSLLAKVSTHSFSVPEVLWSRYAFQFAFMSSALYFNKVSPLGPRGSIRRWLVARGAVGVTSQLCCTFAISRLPLGDAVALHGTYPVITALIAPKVLGEALTCRSVAAAAVAVAGCILVVKGEDFVGHGSGSPHDVAASESDAGKSSSFELLGNSVALTGAFFASLTYIAIRKLVRSTTADPTLAVHPSLVVWVYAFSGLCYLTILSAATAIVSAATHSGTSQNSHVGSHAAEAPTPADERGWQACAMLAGVGLSSIAEQVFVTIGFKGLPASAGTLLLTLETGFAFLFGVFLLHEGVTWPTLLGAGCIATAVLTSVRPEAQQSGDGTEEQHDDDPSGGEAPEKRMEGGQ